MRAHLARGDVRQTVCRLDLENAKDIHARIVPPTQVGSLARQAPRRGAQPPLVLSTRSCDTVAERLVGRLSQRHGNRASSHS
jgi:hypothetical protein